MIDLQAFGRYSNIFLTGAPKSGKSTLLKSLIGSVEKKTGFHTEQLLDARGEKRVGFELVAQNRKTYPFASREESSQYCHNYMDKYWIDSQGLAEVIAGFSPQAGDLIYIDEVAPMALYLDSFFSFVSSLLDSSLLVLGITKLDDTDYPEIQALKSRHDTLIIDITRHPEAKEYLSQLMKKMIKSQQYLQEDTRWTQEKDSQWSLRSASATRTLTRKGPVISCDCQFFSLYGICSHSIALRQKVL